MSSRKKLGAFLGAGKDHIGYSLKGADGEPGLATFDSDDLRVEPVTGKELLDLDNSDTGLIGDYVRYVMDNFSPNDFMLERGNYKAPEHTRGSSLQEAESTGAEDVFVESYSTLGTEMGKYSNSGKFSSDIIDKTAGSDGHDLLPNILGSSGELGQALDTTGIVTGITPDPEFQTKVEKESQSILDTYNRFSPGTRAFADRGKRESEADQDQNMYPQRSFGDYVKGEESDSFSYDDLLEVAGSLMAKSAGWDKAGGTPEDSKNPGSISPSSKADSYSDTQISSGRRDIDVAKLRAKNAYGTPELSSGMSYRSGRGSFLSSDPEEGEQQYGSKSYGSTYTPDNKFDDPSSGKVIQAQALASLIAVSVLGKSLMDDVLDALDDEKSAPLGRGPFLQGVYGSQVDANTRALYHLLLGTVNSSSGFQRSYKKCVNRGISIMFNGKIKTLNEAASKANSLNSAQSNASSLLTGSAGFWLSVLRGILKNVDDVVEESASAALGDYSSIETLVRILGTNKLIGFFKYLAQIGDISLTSSMGMDLNDASKDESFFNVDNLPDGPATRVGKSRSSMGGTTSALAWRGNALPSAYLLPQEILSAVQKMGTGGYGTNPSKGMLASTLWDKTYLDASLSGEGQRIPSDVVERIENMLDSEYVPFYFHDIRTNEIIAFHAFLSTLTDTFSPQYTDVKGYGRMDPVQIYNSTSRTIGVSFVVAATSQEDFDEMWFKLNKLVTLVYPQYSKGTPVASTSDNSKFIQPFSQVLKASPMIRLRVGDVIKSNYSKFNLARLFGVGTPDAVDLKGDNDSDGGMGGLGGVMSGISNFLGDLDDAQLKIFLYAYGTPLALTSIEAVGQSFPGSAAERMTRAAASQLLVNGFGNPILSQVIGTRLRDPDTVVNTPPPTSNLASVTAGLLTGENSGGLFGFGYQKGTVVFLKPADGKAYRYQQGSDVQEVRFSRPIRGVILGREVVSLTDSGGGEISRSKLGKIHKNKNSRTVYRVMITDLGAPTKFLFKGEFRVNHSDLILDPAFMYNIALLPVLSLAGATEMLVESLSNEAAVAAGIPADTLDLSVSDTAQFFSSYTNPIVKAFNSSKGRGLAGFIRRLSVKHLEAGTTWETDWNSRAPKLVKIELGFNPIHDIPPGLDSQGFNRAPIYNAGRVMEYVAGDPHDDNGLASKFKFRDAGAATFKSKKTSE